MVRMRFGKNERLQFPLPHGYHDITEVPLSKVVVPRVTATLADCYGCGVKAALSRSNNKSTLSKRRFKVMGSIRDNKVILGGRIEDPL